MMSQRWMARLAVSVMISLAVVVLPVRGDAATTPTLQVSATAVVSGSTVTFSGRLPGTNRPARLQVWRDGSWVTVMKTTTSSTGRFAFRRAVSGSVGTAFTFRVRGPRATVSGHTYAAVVTPSVKVRIVALRLATSTTSLGLVEGETGTFTLKLSSRPGSTTTVTISSPDTGAVTVQPATLTFTTANWSTAQTVTVYAPHDSDLANESVAVALSANGALPRAIPVTVTDDDFQTVVASSANVAVTEGSSNQFGVHLAFQPAGDVTVSVDSSDEGTAVVSPGSLTFNTANWNISQNVTVSGVQDVDIVSESATVSLTSAGLAQVQVQVAVTDDDSQAIVVTQSVVSVTEGSSSLVGVHLAFQPASSVTVSAGSADTGAAIVSPGSLMFTTANWNVNQNVTVTGVQDGDCSNESVVVGLTSSGVSQVQVTVMVTDDDPCVAFAEEFSDNRAGWTLGPEWQIGSTTASTGHQQGNPDPAQDHTSTADNGVAGAVIGGNPTNAVHSAYALTSPVLNVSGLTTVQLEYWRWLNTDYAPFMTWSVDVFNGTSWIPLDTNAGAGNVLTTDSAWTKYSFDITPYLNPDLRVRFTHAAGKQDTFLGWIMSGWNIDDVVVSGT